MNARITQLRPLVAGAVVASLASALPAIAHAVEDMAMVNAGSIKWADAPPVLPKGAKLAVLDGDPSKPGPVTMRLMMPANYKIAPHTHTQAENLTVISGALYLGMGAKAEPAKAHALQAGGFHHLPGKTPHYVFTKGPTVIQASLEGPFDMSYLDPADDPSSAASK